MRPIETRYALSGRSRIAYQAIGQGSLDLVLVPGFLSNLDLLWEDPGYARLVKRLSVFSRLILFDKRGTGLSDAVDPAVLPDLKTRTDDIRAVMDAAGSQRAALIGSSDGAAMSIALAAAQPERVRALVLHGCYDRFHDEIMDTRRLRAFIDMAESRWGTGATLSHLAPTRAEDRRVLDWWARFERLSASPSGAIALIRMNAAIDVRQALPEITSPTLVIHHTDDPYAPVSAGRQLARAIRGARFAEVPGREHPIWMGDVDHLADLVQEFLTGMRPVADRNRVLAVLLVARIAGQAGGAAARTGARHADERLALFREAVPRLMERHHGYADWLGADRLAARFDAAARAAGGAVALREAAASLGLAIGQGLHVGEIDVSLSPLAGAPVDVADRLAAFARPPEILFSQLASELMSETGLSFVQRGTLAGDGRRGPLAAVVLATERHLEPAFRKVQPRDLGVLSPREREVVALVADGLSNTRIAVQLGLSEHTVKRHVANILLKLDLPTRAAAAALEARRPG